jgi:predicted transcriptional regulator
VLCGGEEKIGTVSLIHILLCDELTKDGIVILPMETPQIKSEIIRAIENLPDDATVEDAMERLYFLAKIERGLEQSESGETISHAEIKARFLR